MSYDQMSDDAEPFGFEVGYTRLVWDDPTQYGFGVVLPHQCDHWTVAWGSKAGSIARMEQFIAEAQEALSELRVLADDKPADARFLDA